MNSLSHKVVERARHRLLKLHLDSGSGHLGGNLSCLEALLCLCHVVLKAGDTFVLSKGHSVGAYYVALWSAGHLEDEELGTFLESGTRLSGHPPMSGLPFAPFATGSLGHGLSLAAGVAKGNQLSGKAGQVYCLMSDGEWQEGQCWEALLFANTHKLNNLSILIDLNGLQGFDHTSEIDPMNLQAKLQAFGADVRNVDGHSPESLLGILASDELTKPQVVILETVKGRGVPGWENEVESHYRSLDSATYQAVVSGEPE